MLHALVTNDDGIDTAFLQALVKGLKTRFNVTVAAPKSEQSWIGRAMSRRRDVHWERSADIAGCAAYAIDGTPSDCVNIALGHLLAHPPDIVCSGINIGFNASLPLIFTSGTVAGAMEGAFWGLPAIAFSHHIEKKDFEHLTLHRGHSSASIHTSLQAAARIAADLAMEALETAADRPIVHNINFPCNTHADTPLEITRPAPNRFTSLFHKKSDDTFTFRYSTRASTPPADSDFACLQRGHISRSILDLSQIAHV